MFTTLSPCIHTYTSVYKCIQMYTNVYRRILMYTKCLQNVMKEIEENRGKIIEYLKNEKSIRFIAEELGLSRKKLTNYLKSPPDDFPLISLNNPSSSPTGTIKTWVEKKIEINNKLKKSNNLEEKVFELVEKYNHLETEIYEIKEELKNKYNAIIIKNNSENENVNKIEEIIKKSKKDINILKSDSVNYGDFSETIHKRTPYCKRILQPVQEKFESFCDIHEVNSSKFLELLLTAVPELYKEFFEDDEILNLLR